MGLLKSKTVNLLRNNKSMSLPRIQEVYSIFPSNYINDVNGWAFDRETIVQNAGKLLTLDIDFGSKCSLNCPFCFRRNNSVDNVSRELKSANLIELIKHAKKLGLRSVKFLGAGEPLENDGILEFLEVLRDLNITPVIFTKTGIMANDVEVARKFSYRGIKSGFQLAQFLYDCDASIIQGFNSLDDKTQCEMAGGDPNIVERRNKTLELLVNIGFTSTIPTRLAVGVNPVTPMNINEAFTIYKWARLRNIYAIVTPTMISGRQKGDSWKKNTPSADELIQLYADIYRFNISVNLSTINGLREDGISAYAGGHPCNQVAAGLYITLNGIVLSCPGSETNIEGNIWQSSLETIWLNSLNYTRRGTFNCHCIAKDGKSIPLNFYQRVAKELGIDVEGLDE